MFGFDRVWLLTWTCYGTRLPGDARGFVGRVRERRIGETDGRRRRHNRFLTDFDSDIPALEDSARSLMKETAARLSEDDAGELLNQFAETAAFRGWRCFAAAVMSDHLHLLVGVAGDPEPEALLRDFKSYGSRALNRLHGRRRWWSDGGSTRKKAGRDAVLKAVRYVRDQPGSLRVRLANEVAEVVRGWEAEG